MNSGSETVFTDLDAVDNHLPYNVLSFVATAIYGIMPWKSLYYQVPSHTFKTHALFSTYFTRFVKTTVTSFAPRSIRARCMLSPP